MPGAVIPTIAILTNSERRRIAQKSSSASPNAAFTQSNGYGSMAFTESGKSPKRPVETIEESDEEVNELGYGNEGMYSRPTGEFGHVYNEACSESCASEDQAELLDFTWKSISRLYLLVPLITLFFLIALVLLITFAWPPNKHERKHGQTYPHPFLWKPLFVGIFAGCTVQTIRVPLYVVFSWFNLSLAFTTYGSTILLSIIHELIRLSTIPLSVPSPTSGFHSSYYLGLGWGIAESVWGIVQGYEQLSLYQDVMKPEEGYEEAYPKSEHGDDATISEGSINDSRFDALQRADEAELERRVEALERMRARRDLEDVIGVPFPTINLALHLLWRLDTLLLNLGLTLVLSSFYFDPIPIYRHTFEPHNPALGPNHKPSPYLWSVWVIAALIHVGVSMLWKVVGRIGVDAVTWIGLIVSLGSVFAGLGGWGGLF